MIRTKDIQRKKI